MSDGTMTYEDWLRGCVHHDGRHGYVTLPCDEVLKIADFIERLRADRKTENCSEKPNNCDTCANGESDIEACGYCRHGDLYEPKDEPQMGDAKPIPLSNRVTHIEDEPQTEEWYTFQDEQEYNARHGKE